LKREGRKKSVHWEELYCDERVRDVDELEDYVRACPDNCVTCGSARGRCGNRSNRAELAASALDGFPSPARSIECLNGRE
jgi:hypothetical protein